MAKSVVLSSAALRNMRDVVTWLTQPGSGLIAHRKLEEIREGIAGLATAASLHPEDPDYPGSRLAVIHRYAVRFKLRRDGTVFVQRIFGPGQLR